MGEAGCVGKNKDYFLLRQGIAGQVTLEVFRYDRHNTFCRPDVIPNEVRVSPWADPDAQHIAVPFSTRANGA